MPRLHIFLRIFGITKITSVAQGRPFGNQAKFVFVIIHLMSIYISMDVRKKILLYMLFYGSIQWINCQSIMVRKLLQGYNEQKSEGEESEFQMDIREE